MEASERDRQEQEYAAHTEPDGTAENVYSPSEYERIKLKPLLPAILAIGGVKQTRGYIIARELAGLSQAKNLDELKDVLLDATDSLLALDIFEAVEFTLDDEPLQRADGEAHLCRVLLRVKEKPRVKLHGGVYAQGNEGVTEASVILTNLLGTAERTSLSAEIGSRHSSEYAVSVAQPRILGLPLEASLAAHQQINCCQWISSYTERLRGTTLSVSGQDRRHTLQYDLAWRTLNDDTMRASPSVREQLGESLKSALTYTFRTGAFDDPTFPLSGYGLRATSSLGGLWPGDHVCRFARQHLAGEYTFSLLPGTACVLSAEAGALLPLNQSPTHITDRFHLGGLGHGLRGFSFKGAGPTDLRRADPAAEGQSQRDALGGDLFASISAIFRFQLPLEALQRAGLYGQAFMNGGSSSLLDRRKDRPFQHSLDQLANTFRWTAGLGILWPTNIGVVELNWCKVLSAQPGDRQRTGLHFGLAVRSQFL